MKRIITFAVAMLSMVGLRAANYEVTSPDGKLTAIVNTDDRLTLSIRYQGEILMRPSPIGLTLNDGTYVGKGSRMSATRPSRKIEHIDAPFYRQKSFNVEWNQIYMRLSNEFGLTLRVYDEGIAYRFATNRTEETIIKSETAEYNFGADSKAWLAYTTTPENPYAMAFQNIYEHAKLDTARREPVFLPATIDCYTAKVTILESDIVSYPNMWLNPEGGKLRASHAPYPSKMEYYPWRHMTHVAATEDYIAKSEGAREYPWRIFAVTEEDTQMPTNNLVYALARPNKIGDTSWIRPGKSAWEWWNDWNLKGVDFAAGINFDTYKYYIDFAAAHNLEYLVLDEGWYDSKAGTIMEPIQAIRLPELISYAKEKNVGLVLWSVFNVMDENLEQICAHYDSMGIKGFKVDFMDRDDQTAVEMVERLAECTAKHHLVLDLHGIYKPVGLERTYPNILNYESVFGMEECRWTDEAHDMPLYDVTFPYIRMMAGPVDFTPGAMRNGTRYDWRAIYTKPISMGTRCHQAACYVVQDSHFTMLADSPTNYEADETYTEFIASLPNCYERTIVVQGEVGKYIVTARRAGDDWYVGGQTNWDGRELTLNFSFLASDATYEARILRDGVNAYRDAEDYVVEKIDVKKGSAMKINMAGGGGFVIKLIKK